MLRKVGRLEEILENRGEAESVDAGGNSAALRKTGKFEEILEKAESVDDGTPVERWRDCLVKALTEMPSELSARILASIPKDILVDILKGVDNPYVKLALLLMKNV